MGQSDMQRFRHQWDGYMERQHADHGFLIDSDHSRSQSTRAQYTQENSEVVEPLKAKPHAARTAWGLQHVGCRSI